MADCGVQLLAWTEGSLAAQVNCRYEFAGDFRSRQRNRPKLERTPCKWRLSLDQIIHARRVGRRMINLYSPTIWKLQGIQYLDCKSSALLNPWYHSAVHIIFPVKDSLNMQGEINKDLEAGCSTSPAEQEQHHVENRGQKTSTHPPPRRLANPAPLGLLSFATGIFLISSFGVHARGIQTPNVMISVLIFFGGVCQYIVGIMEFVNGNTFGATVFSSYAAFNVSYSLIYLPGSGIIAAYINSDGELSPGFAQSLALYVWAWFILTVIYTVAAWRSTWVLFLDLLALDFCLLLLAVGFMTGQQNLSTAGYAFGYVVAALSCKNPLITLAFVQRGHLIATRN